MEELIDLIEEFKHKLNDNEYKKLMDLLMELHIENKNEKYNICLSSSDSDSDYNSDSDSESDSDDSDYDK